MGGVIAAIIIVSFLTVYVLGIFVYDYRRRKKGKPSVFVDTCESEGHGKRLVKQFRKTYRKSH